MNLRNWIFVAMVAMVGASAAHLSLAATSTTKKNLKISKKAKPTTRATLEVYSAMEEEEDEEIAPLSVVSEIQVSKTAPSVTHSPVAYFDVPSRQANLIAARLRIVEAILLESGRAYDYRGHTTQELQSILREVRAQKAAQQMLAE